MQQITDTLTRRENENAQTTVGAIFAPTHLALANPAPARTAEHNSSALPQALAHDARNLVTALGLYCDLLDEPGVLSAPYRHYSGELRLVADACRRLVEKLAGLSSEPDGRPQWTASSELSTAAISTATGAFHGHNAKHKADQTATSPDLSGRAHSGRIGSVPTRSAATQSDRQRNWGAVESLPIANLAQELHLNRNLLAALAGPAISVQLHTQGGELPVRLNSEELTRVLVNLVKNASEAMPHGGQVDLCLTETSKPTRADKNQVLSSPTLSLSVSDNGPGIGAELLEAVFDTGFTTRVETDPDTSWRGQHRGLGLSISRSIIEAAGGSIRALRNPTGGTCFEIQLAAHLPYWTTRSRTATSPTRNDPAQQDNRQIPRQNDPTRSGQKYSSHEHTDLGQSDPRQREPGPAANHSKRA